MKPETVKIIINSPPPPPPLPTSRITESILRDMELKSAENDARNAGVPDDVSERELYEANERISAVEVAKKNLVDKEKNKDSINKDIMEAEDKVKKAEIDRNNTLKEFEEKSENFNKKVNVLNKGLINQLSKALLMPFESLQSARTLLLTKNSELRKANDHYQTLKLDLNAIIEDINTAKQTLSNAEKIVMPTDKEKSRLFKAIQAKKAVNSNDVHDNAEAEKLQKLKSIIDIIYEIKIIEDEIKKLEKNECSDQSVQLDELKERLNSKKLDYQYVLLPADKALAFQMENKFINTGEGSARSKAPMQNSLSRIAETVGIFQKPSTDTAGSKETDSKGAMQKFSS